jgi:(E)-4-hydroxy-3-methylbut-2-enyl-diphosphate synthase
VILDAFEVKKEGRFKEGRHPDFLYDEDAGELSVFSGKGPMGKKRSVVTVHSQEDLNKNSNVSERDEIFHFIGSPEDHPTVLKKWLESILKELNQHPILVTFHSDEQNKEKLSLQATVYLSVLLLQGLPDAIRIRNKMLLPEEIADLSYGILQATGERISKTEFIACPSCGRTLFDIQSTLQVIKKRTGHLKGLKIGVMGCCVNGPGEMADADYGYVGAGRGKITLYKGKKIMKIGIREEEAVDELVRLIKDSGDWK